MDMLSIQDRGNTVVNLSRINREYNSHPDYPYNNHVMNIADSFDDVSHKRSAMFHDVGKLCSAFQAYISKTRKGNEKAPHSFIGAFLYLMSNKLKITKESLSIFVSILKHHGNLDNVNDLADDLSFSDYITDLYPNFFLNLEEVKEIIGINDDMGLDVFCEVFDSDDEFVDAYQIGCLDEYFSIKEVFSKLIFSDKYEAIFKQKFLHDDTLDAGLHIKKLEEHLSGKENELSKVRNSARYEILNSFKENQHKKLYIIEAPTGIGKTFTALHLALEIAKEKNKKRIITALPMTSIIDQTYIEYSKIFGEEMLLKFHYLTSSKVRSSEEVDDSQDFVKQKRAFLTRSWALDKVIITTFNQVLNLFYSNTNRDLQKFWTLRDSVIIIDEVQAIPRILLKDFSKTISFLAENLNIDFILMSATVPDIKNYLNIDLFCELLDNKYFTLDFNDRYSLVFDNEIDSADKLISSINVEYDKGRSVLSVVNSKKIALLVYQELLSQYTSDRIFLLSSYFIPKHREKIIENVSKKLKANMKVILVSTQVIEAGVDLDFDCGFREFSPFYSIIQTAGRVNRENREEMKEVSKLTIHREIGYSPYHKNDLLQEEVEDLLTADVRENELLPKLKRYFEISKNRTSQEMKLIPKMMNLDFKDTAQVFDVNFMKSSPYLTQLFVEAEEGVYEKFIDKLEDIKSKNKGKYLSLEEKMEMKVEIREIYKSMMSYTISVPAKDVIDFEAFIGDDDMRICRFGNLKKCYSAESGYFNSDPGVLVY